jgi:hypothetical protein
MESLVMLNLFRHPFRFSAGFAKNGAGGQMGLKQVQGDALERITSCA